MKAIRTLVLTITLAGSGALQADQIVAEVPDNTGGAVAGSLTGLLLGGAAGGPIGALVGAGAEFFAGGSVQQSAGLSGNGYLVQGDDGAQYQVRSPAAEFSVGQQVERDGIRVRAVEGAVLADGR